MTAAGGPRPMTQDLGFGRPDHTDNGGTAPSSVGAPSGDAGDARA